MEKKLLKKLIKLGVKIIDPNTVFIDKTCIIEGGVTIYPNNFIYNNTKIGSGTILKENNYICNCMIGKDNVIINSYLEDSIIGENNSIGPYSRIRQNSKIGNNVRIGNFVELKKSELKNYVKASHLTYIGDAVVGEYTNIGCGVVFCNYNGREKFKTIIGKNCFIGSNVNLVAPITINDFAFIAAGTTVTKDIEKGKFAVGSRDLKIKEDIKKTHIKEIKNE